MNSNRTELALIARGVNSELAKQLRKKGMTLSKLRSLKDDDFKDLALSALEIASIRKGARPPVPTADLVKVLFANRWLCCVCRDSSLPIVVHHIRPWAESRDHSPENLAVVCSMHHSEAHTARALDMVLSPDRLRSLKIAWEQRVEHLDRLDVHKSTQIQGCHWWYFNHLRLFEVAQEAGVEFSKLAGFQEARKSGFCAKDGAVVRERGEGVLHSGASARYLYLYMTEMLSAALQSNVVRHISDDLDRGKLTGMLIEGDLIFVQGWYSLTELTPDAPGTGPVMGKRSVNNVEIRFVFDRNEGTSNSARALWLRGSQDLGCLLLINRLERSMGKVVISGTVLAIRNAHPDIKQRSYDIGLYTSGLIRGFEVESEEDDIEWIT
ncbi:HNH endonuclease signature motif containing protein [Pseudomonas sp. TWP3-2]|uniref:HNH endonuclease signature motif containing protein n=1 Tax=Pseudomonas sp. TWP3-2 TaxID=2804574 RepID=UPI003CF0B0D8